MKHEVKLTKLIRENVPLQTEADTIVIKEEALKKHMVTHGHENCLKYVSHVEDILTFPDFIGQNRNVKGVSFECIKKLEDNVLVAVKLENKKGYFYVASMYDVKDDKLRHMERSQRVKRIDNE